MINLYGFYLSILNPLPLMRLVPYSLFHKPQLYQLQNEWQFDIFLLDQVPIS